MKEKKVTQQTNNISKCYMSTDGKKKKRTPLPPFPNTNSEQTD
jgi:hypothetical protein